MSESSDTLTLLLLVAIGYWIGKEGLLDGLWDSTKTDQTIPTDHATSSGPGMV